MGEIIFIFLVQYKLSKSLAIRVLVVRCLSWLSRLFVNTIAQFRYVLPLETGSEFERESEA